MSEQDITAADELSVDDFITRGNAIESGKEPPPALETKVPESDPDGEKPPVEVKTDDKPLIDRRTREGRKQSIQAEIDDLTTKKHELKRESDADAAKLVTLRAEIATLEAAKAKPAPAEPAKSTATDRQRYLSLPDAPKLADYDGTDGKTYEDYTADVATFIADRRFDERMSAHTAQQTLRTQHDAWVDRLDAAKGKDPALAAKLATLKDTPLADYTAHFLRTSKIGVDILAYLADHPDIAQRLPTLPPLTQAEELGKLEGQLSAARAAAASPGPAPAPKISTAKPPIKPVDGSPPVSDDDADEGELPVEEFIRRGNKNDPSITPRAARH